METIEAVELADRMSRKRALIVAAAAAAFLLVQLVSSPLLLSGTESSSSLRVDLRAVNAVVLLLVMAKGGGLLNGRKLRALVNDEIARAHRSTALAAGYWVAMAVALVLYASQRALPVSGRVAIYLIVSSSVLVALCVFSYLEVRAHRDA